MITCTLPLVSNGSQMLPTTICTDRSFPTRRIKHFSQTPRLRSPLIISPTLRTTISIPRTSILLSITSLSRLLHKLEVNSAIRPTPSHSPIPSRIKATTRSPTHIIPRQTMTTLNTSLHPQLRRIFNNGEHPRTKFLFETLVSINPSTILKLDRVISLTSLQTLSSCTLINASSLRPIPLMPTPILSKKVSIIATTRSRSIDSRSEKLSFTVSHMSCEDGVEIALARESRWRRGRGG